MARLEAYRVSKSDMIPRRSEEGQRDVSLKIDETEDAGSRARGKVDKQEMELALNGPKGETSEGDEGGRGKEETEVGRYHEMVSDGVYISEYGGLWRDSVSCRT